MRIYSILALSFLAGELHAATLPNTRPLTLDGDLSVQMVAGIDRFLMSETTAAAKRRADFWKRDYRTAETYAASIQKTARASAPSSAQWTSDCQSTHWNSFTQPPPHPYATKTK
jgi:hypothetical protein